MANQTFGIVLAVFQFLTGVALALIMQRFNRLETRMDSVDTLIYERSMELAALAKSAENLDDGQKHIISMLNEQRRDMKGDMKGITDQIATVSSLVRYNERVR